MCGPGSLASEGSRATALHLQGGPWALPGSGKQGKGFAPGQYRPVLLLWFRKILAELSKSGLGS